MERKQDYTSEFRAEAVKVVLTQGLSLAEAAKRLSVPKGTLGNWVTRAKTSAGSGAPGARTVAELEAQVSQLRSLLVSAPAEIRAVLLKRKAEECNCIWRVSPRPRLDCT